jgi:hypothetical protein
MPDQMQASSPPLRIFRPEDDSYNEWSAHVQKLREQFWATWRAEAALRNTACAGSADRPAQGKR